MQSCLLPPSPSRQGSTVRRCWSKAAMPTQAVLWLPAGGFEKQEVKIHIRALYFLHWPCQYLPVRTQRL